MRGGGGAREIKSKKGCYQAKSLVVGNNQLIMKQCTVWKKKISLLRVQNTPVLFSSIPRAAGREGGNPTQAPTSRNQCSQYQARSSGFSTYGIPILLPLFN